MTDRPGEGYPYRYSQLLKKLLNAKGGEPIHEVSPELIADVTLESDRDEFGFLAGTDWWSFAGSAAAGGVGVRSAVGIFNPIGSGLLSVVKHIILTNDTAAPQGFNIGITGTDFGASGGVIVFTDSRQGGFASTRLPGTKGRLKTSGAVPASQTTVGARLALDVSIERNVHIVCSPGFGVVIYHQTDNLLVSAGMLGYERVIEDSEVKA